MAARLLQQPDSLDGEDCRLPPQALQIQNAGAISTRGTSLLGAIQVPSLAEIDLSQLKGTTDMKRTTSWFNPHATAEAAAARQAVISQFFFDTNVRDMRPGDGPVLGKLISHLRLALVSGQVELALIGYADHRGAAAYNKLLARDRVAAVASSLNRALIGTPNFSHVGGFARGEAHAVQGTVDPEVLAWDRRVDVYSSSLIFGSPEARSQMEYVPGVLRVASMEWIKADFSGMEFHGKRPGEALADHLKDQFNDWLADKVESDPRAPGYDEIPLAPGKEREWERRLREVDASHRVTAIRITATQSDSSTLAGVFSNLTTKVAYTWGKPSPYIQVTYDYRSTATFSLLGNADKPTYETTQHVTMMVPRKAAEKLPFFFPNSNWRPTQVGRP
jgi:outer membrane protein OmpA-like peptidoglycan-associated protein